MTADQDTWLYAAFEPARSLEPTEAELAPVIAAVAARRRRRLSRGGRTLAIALPALLLAATAAAAATGLLPVGGAIRGVGFEGDERPVVKETVVASGVQRGVGRWRMTTFATREGVPCLKLTLLDPAARRAPGPASSGYCGGISKFSEFGHGRRAAARARGEVLLFGSAPAGASAIELVGDGGEKVLAKPHVAPAGDRAYWVLAAPARIGGADVAWVDRSGRPRGTLDVSHRFAGPSERTVVATGRTPAGSRWWMTAYESERLSAGGDVYSPEGLPCIAVRTAGPRGQASGFCGVQPRTPGFTRGQSGRYVAAGGRGGGRGYEALVFGHAPERADTVELQAGGRSFSTRARPGPPGVPGRFWLIAGKPEDFANGYVYWVDRDGGARGRSVRLLPP